MLRGEFADAGDYTSKELRSAYESLLAETVDEAGVERVVGSTDVKRETVEALVAGQSPELTLEAAAAILALDEDRAAAETLAADARDVLLLGMTTAVLDVETLASGVDNALEPKEIQGKIEGRYPMTIGEYALLHQYIEHRKG